MRRLLTLIFQLIVTVVIVFGLTAAWLIFDGSTDFGHKADAALVTSSSDVSDEMVRKPLLDLVVQRYNDGEFPFIIVSGTKNAKEDQPREMAKYLVEKGLPDTDILRIGAPEETTQEVARQTAELMKTRGFHSVMVFTDYYHMIRVKLTLNHEGVTEVKRAHFGTVQKEDAWEIGRELIAVYDYVGRMYVLPAAEKLKDEAQGSSEKLKAGVEDAKQNVNKKLDTMNK